MIRHVVMFKVKDGILRDGADVLGAFEALRALEGCIPEIREWEVGKNFSPRPIAADYVLLSAFDTVKDLEVYVGHRAHRDVVDLLREVCTWQVCDFED